ncbi:stage V sporulation protein B [Methanobrevibacter gottschalkii]|uniref:Stage V sporulation protein B n=1 Tax=Methanobrevibacter gottschalkii TaxID=190974 RepID=A0A1H7F6G3_9EURY|nr:flippase [Methanobrevibacter gottschalkii]SEK21703.1 stage V sporulation protein B [Methanobrevibacter gottschalkii]
MANKLIRGSLIILIGNVIFRIGGYIYRFLMAILLGPTAYGILGITLPFQGIFQTLSAGGLPPAIAKYVAEYEAIDEKDMARQTIYTALKIMVFLGLFFGVLMIFIVAPYLAYGYLGKPEALIPLQIVGLITPFSVIVGAFRGAFQGVYKMEYIVYTRAVEQLGMILFATAFVLIGLSTVGALWGTVLGYSLSVVAAVYIFKYHMGNLIPEPSDDFVFTRCDELKLATVLVKFSVPVIITAIAEMLIYNICTIVMGKFLTFDDIGFFAAADPIARLPLIISISIATTILPASSEAFKLKDIGMLQKYVSEAYKFSLLFVVPMCVGLALFAEPTLRVLYFKNPAYVAGAMALAILSIGMTFYSIFAISTSIVQGIGNPRIPMYILVGGAVVTGVLNWIMVPTLGIAGGALATSVACFLMMVPCIYFVFRLTKTKAPVVAVAKILVASAVMGIVAYFIPKSTLFLFPGIVLCMVVYFFALILVKFFQKDDIESLRKFSSKFGPFSKLINKMLNFVERIEFR